MEQVISDEERIRVKDWVSSGLVIFSVMNLVTSLKFYWVVLPIAALISFIGWYYYKQGWISLFYGIGGAAMCVVIFSVLATTVILLVVALLTSSDEDEYE